MCFSFYDSRKKTSIEDIMDMLSQGKVQLVSEWPKFLFNHEESSISECELPRFSNQLEVDGL